MGVSSLLQPTSNPQPGDIGYLNANQHHFIIASVDGDNIVSIDGNSLGNGSIAEHTRRRSEIAAFYRIPV